ncbi:MAG: outer membrane protein [Flavobacteriales bacterium]|jgi:outer membrane protein
MKKSIILGFALLLATAVFGQTKKWTLQECVQYAVDNNITIKQRLLDLDQADLDRSDAVGNFLPTVNASFGVSERTGLSFDPLTNQAATETFLSANGGLNVGYNLFDGLQNVRRIQRAKLSAIAAEYNIAKIKDDISLLVANGFLDIILNKENLKTVEAQNLVTLEQIERTIELVEGGVLPRGDLLEIQSTAAIEQQRIVAARNSVILSRVSLAQLMAIKDYQGFDIADGAYSVFGEELMDEPIGAIIESAKGNRFEIKIAEQNLELAEKDVQITKGSFLPSLRAFFGYNTAFADSNPLPFNEQIYINDGINYGLSLNVPILNGFSVKNNVKRGQLNVERNRISLEQAKLDLESTIYQAYMGAKAAKQSYEAALVALNSQELAYAYAKDRYDVGLTNAFDFSQSKLRYDNAQIELSRSKYDYIFRIKVLELYFGVPATELKF